MSSTKPARRFGQAAERCLVEAFQIEGFIRALLYRYTRNASDVDDLLQETYVRLYDWASRRAPEVQSARSLAFSIARNVARDWVRSKQVVPLDLVADLQSVDSADERERLEERIDAQQQLEIIAQALRGLPRRSRRVFVMRKVYGHSQKEIAAKLGIAEHTVEHHLFLATRRFADILSGMPSARGFLTSLAWFRRRS